MATGVIMFVLLVFFFFFASTVIYIIYRCSGMLVLHNKNACKISPKLVKICSAIWAFFFFFKLEGEVCNFCITSVTNSNGKNKDCHRSVIGWTKRQSAPIHAHGLASITNQPSNGIVVLSSSLSWDRRKHFNVKNVTPITFNMCFCILIMHSSD